MPSGKDRLYIALYARSGKAKMPDLEDTYHWGLLVGPKAKDVNTEGMKFHAKESLVSIDKEARWTWNYEECSTPMRPTGMILVRILIAKVRNKDRLVSVLQRIPVKGGEPGWNCIGWVKDALEQLEEDGSALSTSVTAWPAVRNGAMQYVEDKKTAHRFDGKGKFDTSKVPTWDLIERKALIP